MAQLHKGPIRSDLLDGTLDGYQAAAQTTAVYPGQGTYFGLMYLSVKSGGENGEFQDKVGKLARDKDFKPDYLLSSVSEEDREALILELGDELWYLAARAKELGISLNGVAIRNIEKLISRQTRGTLSGSGDNR